MRSSPQKLNTSYIRILADLEPGPEGEVDDNYIIEVLKKLIPIGGGIQSYTFG